MRNGVAIAVLFLVAALPVPVTASGITDTEPRQNMDAAAGELTDIFAGLCLDGFPNEPGFAKAAAARNLQPMDAASVKRYLHDDPGRGWSGTSSFGSYVVTIESPPYLACAVRRARPSFATFQPDPFRLAFQRLIGAWAEQHHLPTLRDVPPMRQVVSGMTINTTMQAVVGPDGKPTEAFMVLVTDYSNGTYELRLVHQFPPK
jgi:hypothetical protein